MNELELKLAELKTTLEASTNEKAKAEVALQIKSVQDAINAEVKKASDAAEEVKGELETVKKEAGELKAKVIELEKKGGRIAGGGVQTKSFGEVLTSALEEKTDDIAKMARGEKGVKSVEMELKAVGDILTTNVTGGSVWGANYKPGIIENANRKVHMRQVMVGGGVGAGTDYYFMKENGVGEGSIAFTAESSTKPQRDFDLVESSVKIETLAGWARVSRKAMNNIPGFASFLNNRLVESLLKAEDAGILYGDGTSPNIKGILASGNFTASTSSATVLAEKLIDDIATIDDTYERDANLILMRPQHYYGFFKNTASGSGEYDLPKNVMIVNGVLYISGVMCLPTTALNINAAPTPDTCDYIVGDFKNGAQFLTQESMRIEIFEQDGTNVRENKITVRIEETVALPVFGSDYFIKGTHAVTI